MKTIVYLFLSLIVFSSCFKEEDKRLQNTIASETMKLGEDYGNVYYYNLSTQSVVSQNYWSEWDLAFYAQDDDFYIKLNYAANMKAYETNNKSFENLNQLPSNSLSKVDDATGNRNNLALNFEEDYISNDTIFYKDKSYILLIGTIASGQSLGYKKVSLKYIYQNKYYLRHANLDGTEDYLSEITKDVKVNFVHFSFNNNGETISIEPDKTTWDLEFTRSTDAATTIGHDTTIYDYSVTSALLNPYSALAYLEINTLYEDINQNNIEKNKLSNNINTIGYGWKVYDINSGVYGIYKNKSYIVKDINDFYYKLRFLSFYDPKTNIKGSISFQYEIIK